METTRRPSSTSKTSSASPIHETSIQRKIGLRLQRYIPRSTRPGRAPSSMPMRQESPSSSWATNVSRAPASASAIPRARRSGVGASSRWPRAARIVWTQATSSSALKPSARRRSARVRPPCRKMALLPVRQRCITPRTSVSAWNRISSASGTNCTSLGSPGVGLRRRAARAGPDLVEARRDLLAHRDLERAQGAIELLLGARADDRRGHGLVRKQPGERDVGRILAQFAAEALVGLELRLVLLDLLLERLLGAPAAVRLLLEHAAEQAARERAPGDHAQAVVLAGGQDLELDGARGEVVEALLADQAEGVA